MNDLTIRISCLTVLYFLIFGSVFLFGEKWFPKRALSLTLCGFIVSIAISFYSGALGGITAFVLAFIFIFFLRRPNGTRAMRQFYADHAIYASTIVPQAALDVLGDKKWRYAEGSLQVNSNEKTKYLFWRGYTSSMVSTGQYTRSTTFTHYLAFIFLPGTANEAFKQRAIAAADKSGYSFRERIRFFFRLDMDKPCLVKTAADGSFIIQYYTEPYAEQYSKQLAWIKENYSGSHFTSNHFISAN
ncbi:hypothetical protein [Ferruginibacter sp.]